MVHSPEETRWRWTNASRSRVAGVTLKVKDATDVAFEGTGLANEESFTYFNGQGPWVPESDTAGNGKVLAVQDGEEEYITITRWEPGTRYHNDGGWFNGAGTPMGKRVFFANPPTGNVQDLSDKGIIVFENLINDLILEKDTSAPTITIKGNNPFTVMQNGQYSDAGVDVVDNRDPKPKLSISSSIRSTLEFLPVCVRVPSVTGWTKPLPIRAIWVLRLLDQGFEKALNEGAAWATTQQSYIPGKFMTKTVVCHFTKILMMKHG